jgi:shikimate kinase
MSSKCLIVLNGPVGVGKSTVARASAERLRRERRGTAVIDLDVVYGMARQSEGFGDVATWRAARSAAPAMATAFFDAGLDVVIVEGGFDSVEELADVTARVPVEVRTLVVTLEASFATVWQRVSTDPDPGRVASRHEPFLQQLHDQFRDALPSLASAGVVLNAERRTPEELASAVSELSLRELATAERPNRA